LTVVIRRLTIVVRQLPIVVRRSSFWVVLTGAATAMKLFVGPMDAVVVEVSADGRVRLENEDWSTPTLQERRAILYAAKNEIEELKELSEILERTG